MQDVNSIVSNLSKLDYEFAYSVVNSTFKGNHRNLLIQFINKEISAEYVKAKWGQLNLTGKITEDIKLEEATLLDQFKFISFLLSKLEINNDYNDIYKHSLISDDECAKSLAILVHSIYTKFKARNKESLAKFLELVREDKNKGDVFIQDGLIPHEPEITDTEVEILNEEDEIEINPKELETLSI